MNGFKKGRGNETRSSGLPSLIKAFVDPMPEPKITCGAFEVNPLPVVGRIMLASNRNIVTIFPEFHPVA